MNRILRNSQLTTLNSQPPQRGTAGIVPVFCALLAAIAIQMCFAGCASFSAGATARKIASTPAGSELVAKAADKVVQKGLNATADTLDKSGNPYLHSVADAIRANPDGIVDPANVQKIFRDYGDPNNQTKFKTLAWDVWHLAKDAAVRFGKETAAELLARGLQKGAEGKAN